MEEERCVCSPVLRCVVDCRDAPISRFEVFWQPIMHLEVIWCEAEELRWGGCGMWVRINVGKWVFGGFSSHASVPDSSLMALVFASSALFNMEMHVTRHIRKMPLFWLKPSSATDKESTSHTHTAHVCFHRWMDFFFLALIVPVMTWRIPEWTDVFFCFFFFFKSYR